MGGVIGSRAAVGQARIGNVVAGSVFAVLQGLGASIRFDCGRWVNEFVLRM